MKSIAKADAAMRGLKETLEIRKPQFAALDTFRLAKDAKGFPVLIASAAGAEAADEAVVAIRIKADDSVSKDIFGNDLVAFAPHTLEIAHDPDSVAAVDAKDMAIIQIEAAKQGMKIQVKTTEANEKVEDHLEDATLVVELDWLQFPTKLA